MEPGTSDVTMTVDLCQVDKLLISGYMSISPGVKGRCIGQLDHPFSTV